MSITSSDFLPKKKKSQAQIFRYSSNFMFINGLVSVLICPYLQSWQQVIWLARTHHRHTQKRSGHCHHRLFFISHFFCIHSIIRDFTCPTKTNQNPFHPRYIAFSSSKVQIQESSDSVLLFYFILFEKDIIIPRNRYIFYLQYMSRIYHACKLQIISDDLNHIHISQYDIKFVRIILCFIQQQCFISIALLC